MGLARLDHYHELERDEKEQANVKMDPKDFLEEAEREKKELNESYQESVRQTKERTAYDEHNRDTSNDPFKGTDIEGKD